MGAGDRVSPALLAVLMAFGLAALVLAGLAWSRRGRMPGASALVVLMLATAQILVFYSLSFADVPAETAIRWLDLTYIGWLVGPPALMVFIAQLTGRDSWLSARSLALLGIEPVLMAVIIWSPLGQEWFFAGGRDPATLDFPGASAAYLLFVAYAQVMLAISTWMVIATARSSRLLRPGQIALVTILVLLPWIVSFFSVVNAKVLGADPTVLALVAMVAFAYALTQFRLLDIRPLLTPSYAERVGDGVVVIDVTGRIVEMNATAARLLGIATQVTMGRRIEDAFSGAQEVIPALLAPDDAEVVLELPDGTMTVLWLGKSELTDRQGLPVGTLVIVRPSALALADEAGS